MKTPVALTIAGSDSSGGAGIQADLKTFAALRVHGMSAITCVTAQNTREVVSVQGVDPSIVEAQIKAVVDDVGVDAVKTGMLYRSEIIHVVAEQLRRSRFPLVVDPVMVAKSGAKLLEINAVRSLIDEILPLATVVTPNVPEAEALTKLQVRTVDDAERAAKAISDLGPKAVVVKGGHIPMGEKVFDVLYLEGRHKVFEGKRLYSKNTHGTGCTFASAITAELAKGRPIVEAVGVAKDFVTEAIRWGVSIGTGFGPVNPVGFLYEAAEKYEVLCNVKEGVRILEGCSEFSEVIPESQTNLGMALTYAETQDQVAAVPGRLVKIFNRAKASGCPEFGATRHIASTILAVMKFDPTMRAAMNIKYSEELVATCRELGLKVSFYDRREEPEEVRRVEGRTTAWGAEQSVKRLGFVPDVIYHTGDYGKEAMIVLLGRTATDVAKKAIEITNACSAHRKMPPDEVP